MKNAVIRLKRVRGEPAVAEENDRPIDDVEEFNLVLQRQLVHKDAELEAKDRQLQKKIEELNGKDKEITSLQLRQQGRFTNLSGLIVMFVVGVLFAMIFKVV